MSDYTKTTNFAAKDSLPSGNSGKIVKGTEIDTEFDNIQTAIATKADIAGPTFTGTITIPTVDLNGGAIDGTTVGASTAAAITGTTIVANTSINIAGDGATVTGIKDEDDMSSNSATKLATQQSIKAYVDSQVTAQDLDFQADSGGALSIDLDSETLTFTGGTGVDTSGSGNAVTFAIDSTVATLTGTQTLTNKTLTSPTLNTPTIGTSFTIGSATITEAELEILDGATVTTAELNVLDGITSTTAELNILDGVTSTAAELNILDGVTSTAAELNILDGVTSTAAELNILDGVTATTAELNIMDGVTATTAELNIMDGVTATTAELNYVDGVTSNVQTQLDAKAPIASPTFTGTVTVPGLTTSADILFADNDKAIFGAGSDLQIYHDGTHSNIKESGAGDLQIFGDNVNIYNAAGSQNLINLTSGGANTFFHNGSAKLATTSTGIDVTGNATFADNGKAIFGAGSDLQIYHDGSNSYIDDAGTGNLKIRTAGTSIRLETTDGDRMLVGTKDGDFRLYYDDVEKLATTSTGIDVTGTATMDGLTVDTSALVVDATNNRVGIGTSSPSRTLHVNAGNDNNVALFESSDANAIVTIKDNTTTNTINANAGIMVLKADSTDAVAGSYMAFEVDTSEAMRIDASGNLLVGTTSVINTGKVSVVFTGASGNGISLKTTTASNGSKFLSFANSGGTEIGYIEENTNTSVNYSTSSDQRLKENITDADDAGSKVDAIQVRKFDWIADGSHQDYGMVAQELQTVAPEAVSGDADSEDMMGVDYSKLVPMLVKEIQSLRARVAQLEN